MTHANTTIKTKAFTALYSTNGDFYLTTNATQYEVKCRVECVTGLSQFHLIILFHQHLIKRRADPVILGVS